MTDSEAALPLLSRYAIMVDVGYIYASAGELLFSASSRREYRVEAAQAFGVRVHLWGVEPPYGTNQAERLVWESDTVEVLERARIEPYFAPQPTADTAHAGAHGHARSDHSPATSGISVGQITAPSPAQLFGDKNPFRSHAKQNSTGHVNAHLATARLGPSRERVEEAGEHVAQKRDR